MHQQGRVLVVLVVPVVLFGSGRIAEDNKESWDNKDTAAPP
jgi:hypothetical protein